MVRFTAKILRFEKQGEKTGWTYIEIPASVAEKINPGIKKSYRVKGKLDNYVINGVALMPMGGGAYIMPLNATMRKGIGKRSGAMISIQVEKDSRPYQILPEFMECLADEPQSLEYFQTLAVSHRNYFSKWIESAKTEQTRTKRLAQAVTALSKKQGFPEMMRSIKQNRDLLGE